MLHKENLQGQRNGPALAALPEELGSIPAPTWWLTTTCHSSSTGPDALFWLVHAAQTLAVKTLIDMK